MKSLRLGHLSIYEQLLADSTADMYLIFEDDAERIVDMGDPWDDSPTPPPRV